MALVVGGWRRWHAAELRAGVAKADLDPPPGIPMAGYGAARFAKGTLDPIEARVLALSDGNRTIAMVTLDLCFTFDPRGDGAIRRPCGTAWTEWSFMRRTRTRAPLIAKRRRRSSTPSRASESAIQIGREVHGPGANRQRLGPDVYRLQSPLLESMAPSQMFWRNEPKISTTFPVDPTVGVIRVDRQRRNAARRIGALRLPSGGSRARTMSHYSADYPGEMRRVYGAGDGPWLDGLLPAGRARRYQSVLRQDAADRRGGGRDETDRAEDSARKWCGSPKIQTQQARNIRRFRPRPWCWTVANRWDMAEAGTAN